MDKLPINVTQVTSPFWDNRPTYWTTLFLYTDRALCVLFFPEITKIQNTLYIEISL